jgi:hypothetical protein
MNKQGRTGPRCAVYETRVWYCEDCRYGGCYDCGNGEPYVVRLWRCAHHYGQQSKETNRCWWCGETGWSVGVNGGHGMTEAQNLMHFRLPWMSWLHRYPRDEQDYRECLYGVPA